MASHRPQAPGPIDPVGLKVDGWISPFLFGMDVPEVVATVFHDPMAALALAPPDQSVDTLTLQYRQGAALARVSWNPYLYDPLLRRRLGPGGAPPPPCWGAPAPPPPPGPRGGAQAEGDPGAEPRGG